LEENGKAELQDNFRGAVAGARRAASKELSKNNLTNLKKYVIINLEK
jgi:hypothetical protein